MKTRTRSADPAAAAGALLTLFRPGRYTGEPFSIPGENQLRMTDAIWGSGNSTPADPFAEAMHLCGMTGLSVRKPLEDALADRHFSLTCGKADPMFIAARGMLALMLHRQINRFIVLVRGSAERESASMSLSAYLEQSVRGLSISPTLSVYAGGESDMTGEGIRYTLLQLRQYVCDPSPRILIMNREYCNRPKNLLLRPDVLLDHQTPASLLAAARPVVITISENAAEVRSLLQLSGLFCPLCTLSFTEDADTSGLTVPFYAPGMRQSGIPAEETEQITL